MCAGFAGLVVLGRGNCAVRMPQEPAGRPRAWRRPSRRREWSSGRACIARAAQLRLPEGTMRAPHPPSRLWARFGAHPGARPASDLASLSSDVAATSLFFARRLELASCACSRPWERPDRRVSPRRRAQGERMHSECALVGAARERTRRPPPAGRKVGGPVSRQKVSTGEGLCRGRRRPSAPKERAIGPSSAMKTRATRKRARLLAPRARKAPCGQGWGTEAHGLKQRHPAELTTCSCSVRPIAPCTAAAL